MPILFRTLFFALPCLFCCLTPVSAQQIVWNKFFGGSGFDNACGIALNTEDGSMYIGGTVRSQDGDVKKAPGGDADFWVVKLNYKGEFIWSKALGGRGTDEAKDIKNTQDGGCIIIGTSNSIDGDVKDNHGKMDACVVRLSKNGEVLWSRALGGTGNDKGNAILPTSDGGFIVLGESGSKNGDMTMSYGGLDAWVCKLDENGEIIWQRSYGGSGSEAAMAAIELDDRSIVVLCATDSKNFEVEQSFGNKDLWLLRIEDLGKLLWAKSYGGEDNDEAHALVKAHDGGFLIAGTTFSQGGHIKSNKGYGDLLLVKTDFEGELQWTKTYGGSEPDGANQIFTTKDKNYVVVGTTQSKNGNITRNRGSYEGWVLKLDVKGNIVWQNTFGGKTQDMLYGGCETATTDYICVGYSESTDGDNTPTGFKGGGDWWVLNLRDPGKAAPAYRPPFAIKGRVRDAETNTFLPAQIEIVDNTTHKVIKSGAVNPLKGTFEFFIPKDKKISISISIKGYMFYGDNIVINPNEDEMYLDIELEKIKVGSKLVLDDIVFDAGLWDIKPESEPELQRILKFMNLNPEVNIALNGHTDNTGDPNTKRKLSFNRATEIMKYLEKNGIYSPRMVAKGYGMSQPIATNANEEGRQKNRRVEFEITAAP